MNAAAESWFNNLSREEGYAALRQHGSPEAWAAAEMANVLEAGLDATEEDLADAIRELYGSEDE